MRPRRVVVHQRRRRGSRRLRALHERVHLRRRFDARGAQTSHRRVAALIVLDVVLDRRRPAQQILDVFVVNLHHRRRHAEFGWIGAAVRAFLRLARGGVASLENLLDGSRNQTPSGIVRGVLFRGRRVAARRLRTLFRLRLSSFSAEHGVRLSRSRLSVGEDAHLVSVQRRAHEVRNFLKHLALSRRLAEDAVKGKLERFRPARGRHLEPSTRPLASSRRSKERLVAVLPAADGAGTGSSPGVGGRTRQNTRMFPFASITAL